MVFYTDPGPIEYDGVLERSDVSNASAYVPFPFFNEEATPQIQNSPAQMSGTGEMAGLGAHSERDPHISAGAIFGNSTLVPLEGFEPPTVSLGRNCSSVELQRLTQKV